MELFPSMTYNDVLEMPYKSFKALQDIRVKRKIKEQKDIEAERKKMEEKNQRELARNKIIKSR